MSFPRRPRLGARRGPHAPTTPASTSTTGAGGPRRLAPGLRAFELPAERGADDRGLRRRRASPAGSLSGRGARVAAGHGAERGERTRPVDDRSVSTTVHPRPCSTMKTPKTNLMEKFLLSFQNRLELVFSWVSILSTYVTAHSLPIIIRLLLILPCSIRTSAPVPNGVRYPLVISTGSIRRGGMRQRRLDGTNSKPRKLLENAPTPTTMAPVLVGDRVHAVLGGDFGLRAK